MSTTAPQTRHTVTAIIVAHDGARLLPGLVQALQAQTYPVDRVVGVDTGSRDRSGSVLAELIGQDAVFGMDRNTGYGDAIAVALRHSAARRVVRTDPNMRRVEWIWLLHDDCEPTPETLELLLRAASRDRSVVVLGPKVLDESDRRVLREAGVAIDRAGRRITGIEPGEIDQGQHDANRAVMSVGSAGMLIRRDVWDQLGGFDTRLNLFRDDLDFCWRVHAAGLRVQVVTDALLYHRELSARRRRTAQDGNSRGLDRRNALYVLAVNLPLLTMLRVVTGCIAGSLVRAAYFLLSKQLDLAAAQIYAVAGLLGHPVRLWKGRRRRAAGRREGYAAVRTFILPGRPLSRLAESIAGLLSSGPPKASGGMHHAASEEPEDDQFVDVTSLARRIIGNPGVQLFAALLLIALVAERGLLGSSPLGGGALVPAWGGASGLWQEYLAGFHAVGVGSTASAPPYLVVVAALATVLGGQAWLAVDVLLLGCVPLAGVTAYLAARRLVTTTGARLWLAASYALLPVATGAIAAGRLGTAFAFTMLPLIGICAGRMLTAAPRPARRAAWATGLLIALAAAFAPLMWVFGAAFAAVVLAARLVSGNRQARKVFANRGIRLVSANGETPRWLAPVRPVDALIVVATPFAVLFPWSLHLLASPSAFFAEAGIQQPGLSTAGLRPSDLMLLSPGGPGLPPAWVTAGFGLAVLATLLPHRRTAVTSAGWCVAAVGFLGAVAVSRTTSTPAGASQAVSGWPGVALAVAALGLLLAAAPAADWLAHAAAGRGLARKLLGAAALAAVATVPVLAAGYWVTDGVRGPIGSVTSPVLPAFVSASSTGGAEYRTLILRQNGPVLDYSVVRQSDPILGEPELTGYSPAEQALSHQVAALGAPDGADAGDPGLLLGEFGIRWVLLPGPVDAALAQRLDAAVGLIPLSTAPAYDLWQVTGPVARVRVVAADGAVTTLPSQLVGMSAVSAPAAGGTLLLAEPYGGWTAKLNGVALKPLAAPVDGWAQGFVLPSGGGQLVITRNNAARNLSLIAELIALLAVCLLALPGKRAEPVAEAEALAAIRAAQHGRRAARRTPPVARPGRFAHGARSAGFAIPAGFAGRAMAGFGRGRRRPPAAPDAGAQENAPALSAAAFLAEAEEAAHTAQWNEHAHWEQASQWDDGSQWGESGQRDMPVRLTGPQPAALRDTGPWRAWQTGPQGTAPWEADRRARSRETGPQATWQTGPQPARQTGPQPARQTGPQPARQTGPQAARQTGPQGARQTGPQAARQSGPQAGWQSGPQAVARENAAQPSVPAERHSHRAGRHGRPRRRGPGDRPLRDGES